MLAECKVPFPSSIGAMEGGLSHCYEMQFGVQQRSGRGYWGVCSGLKHFPDWAHLMNQCLGLLVMLPLQGYR